MNDFRENLNRERRDIMQLRARGLKPLSAPLLHLENRQLIDTISGLQQLMVTLRTELHSVIEDRDRYYREGLELFQELEALKQDSK